MNRRISVNTGSAVPQSFVTKGKQRLKQHTDTVYLNNGDEFEIELFNPTHNKVLAKIEMNGNSIGAGIILRPGERVFLERYLDEAKKFLFETYMVNGSNEEVQQAIANNGDVVVKFYDEVNIPTRTIYNGGNSTLTINNPNWDPYWLNQHNYTTHNTLGTNTFNPTSVTTTGTNAFYTSNSSLTSGTFSTSNTLLKNSNKRRITKNEVTMDSVDMSPLRSMETGRVEKGSNSDQSFTYDNSSFRSYPSTTNWWKILPQSTKPVLVEELKTYCTECGVRRKKDTHKFCPHCGTKF